MTLTQLRPLVAFHVHTLACGEWELALWIPGMNISWVAQ